jgi:uncharacterized protein YdhG (YjbR/CyaY superfamily)
MRDPASATAQIDATLAAAPADQRAVLQALRETIAATAPDAVETISYGMPAFRYHKKALVSYSPFRDHCSFFPMSAGLMDSLGEELAGWRTAKGTIQFTPDRPLPGPLVEKIVRGRMAEIDSKA